MELRIFYLLLPVQKFKNYVLLLLLLLLLLVLLLLIIIIIIIIIIISAQSSPCATWSEQSGTETRYSNVYLNFTPKSYHSTNTLC